MHPTRNDLPGLARPLTRWVVALACASSFACASSGRATSPLECPAQAPLLAALDPAIAQDVRYATADNFTGAPLPGYERAIAVLHAEPAAALARVQRRLERDGYGLLVWDAYRPVRATLAMVEWAERSGNGWVLDQGYVARRSGHNRGNTVDLTIVGRDTGEPIDMGTAYDHFGEASHTVNAVGVVRRNRQLLLDAMGAEGFENYDKEWWHFSHPGDYEAIDVPIACYVQN